MGILFCPSMSEFDHFISFPREFFPFIINISVCRLFDFSLPGTCLHRIVTGTKVSQRRQAKVFQESVELKQ